MMTPSELFLLIPAVDAKHRPRLLRGLYGIRTVDQDRVLAPADVLLAYLYEWLSHFGLYEHAEVTLAVDWCRAVVEPWGAALAAETPASGTPRTVTVVDQRYLGTGPDRPWYDISREVEVADLPEPGVTFFVWDATAAWHKKERWRQRREHESRPAAKQ